jgi:6-pyruvoyltetrahydropterin/6-carboxytetrahydropterin synthase
MRYSIMVRKKHLSFSSSHFVVEGDTCESLHGHNYRVSVELEGSMDTVGYVMDFTKLKYMIREIISPLDHKILIASQNISLRVTNTGGGMEVTFKEKKYLFPKQECVILPIPNCTAEHIAAHILARLVSALREGNVRNVSRIRVGVEESEGQWAFVEEELTP